MKCLTCVQCITQDTYLDLYINKILINDIWLISQGNMFGAV